MAALGWIAFFIISTVLNGFALKVLWAWFITETFGVKVLTIPQALGISLVVSFLTSHYTGEDKRSTAEKAIYMILMPLLFLLIGWIYHLFM